MLNSTQRIELIREHLTRTFTPLELEIIDESDQHIGHRSAQGKGHFQVRIVADAFQGKKPLERHRMVYAALGETMENEIHALSIHAKTPAEAR